MKKILVLILMLTLSLFAFIKLTKASPLISDIVSDYSDFTYYDSGFHKGYDVGYISFKTLSQVPKQSFWAESFYFQSKNYEALEIADKNGNFVSINSYRLRILVNYEPNPTRSYRFFFYDHNDVQIKNIDVSNFVNSAYMFTVRYKVNQAPNYPEVPTDPKSIDHKSNILNFDKTVGGNFLTYASSEIDIEKLVSSVIDVPKINGTLPITNVRLSLYENKLQFPSTIYFEFDPFDKGDYSSYYLLDLDFLQYANYSHYELTFSFKQNIITNFESYLTSLNWTFNVIKTIDDTPNVPTNPDELGEVTTFDKLPLTTGGFGSISDKSKVGQVKFFDSTNDKYHVQVIYNGKKYVVKDVDLPGVKDLKKAPIKVGIYYTQKGERHLYYEFQNDPSDAKIKETLIYDENARINGFRPFAIWNTTTGKYDITDKLRVFGNIHTEGKKAYVDVLFGMKIDDLLSITFKYNFNYHYLLGVTGKNQEATINRVKGESVDISPTFWNAYKDHIFFRNGLKFWETYAGFYEAALVTTFQDTIQNMSSKASSVDYQNNYINKLNKILVKNKKTPITRADFGTNSLYRVYLNTFDYGLSTGFTIHDDYAILDLLYEKDGEYFHVGMEDIDFDGAGGGQKDSDDLLAMLKGWLAKGQDFINFFNANKDWLIPLAVIIVIGIILLLAFAPSILVMIVKLIISALVFVLIRVPIMLIVMIFKVIISIFKKDPPDNFTRYQP